MIRRTLLAAGLASLAAIHTLPTSATEAALQLEVYNPGDKAIFPVSSEIVSGRNEAVLIDAQFQRNDAETVVQKIKASGKKLSTVYISHSDPDFYFGLDVIKAAFPDAKIVATPQTVAAIKASMDGKLSYWTPILKDNAPKALVLPEPLEGDTILLEGRKLEVKGLKSASPARSYVWIPSLKTVAGGVPVFNNTHVWIADTQTPASRQAWRKTLDSIAAQKPATVVPGHYLGEAPKGLEAVKFTAGYLETFEREAAKAKDSAELIAAMKKRYPSLGQQSSLELSAKVIKGEMKWPAH